MQKIEYKFITKKRWSEQEFEAIFRMFPRELMALALEDRNNMRMLIKNSKRRPDTGEGILEEAIDVEEIPIPDGHSVGVGNISLLDRVAKYWAILNFGGSVRRHKVPVGAFVPGNPQPNSQDFRGGNWEVGAGNYSFVSGKRPIIGITYIESSYNMMLNRVMVLKGLK